MPYFHRTCDCCNVRLSEIYYCTCDHKVCSDCLTNIQCYTCKRCICVICKIQCHSAHDVTLCYKCDPNQSCNSIHCYICNPNTPHYNVYHCIIKSIGLKGYNILLANRLKTQEKSVLRIIRRWRCIISRNRFRDVHTELKYSPDLPFYTRLPEAKHFFESIIESGWTKRSRL